MFSLKASFMEALGIGGGASHPLDLHRAASGLVIEAAEVLEETAKMAKPWKPAKGNPLDITEEIVDVTFYAVEILMRLGVTEEDFMNAYTRKYSINMARIFKALDDKTKVDLAELPMTEIEVLAESHTNASTNQHIIGAHIIKELIARDLLKVPARKTFCRYPITSMKAADDKITKIYNEGD